MPSLLSKVFRGKDTNGVSSHSKKSAVDYTRTEIEQPRKPRWDDAWSRDSVAPSEVQELLNGCTKELKARGVTTPFLLLPYRPASDPSAARTFIRNFFNAEYDRGETLTGDRLLQELRLTEHMVLCSVIKWCWSRLPGGVITWEVYELFKIGEQDSNYARDAFTTFVPLAVEDAARLDIITQFFELLAALAANGKKNGLGGRKLSRYAGWWAFEHSDQGAGFDGGYKSWVKAADATCHLFFAYLRSLSPEMARGASGITALPMSLTGLVQATEYPPEFPSLMQTTTTRMVMIVSNVSETPFALLRRARNFEYRDDDAALQAFSQFEDPMKALTEECLRVLRCISSTNQSVVSSSKASTSLRDASWSRFEDIGFSGALDESDHEEESELSKFQRSRNASKLANGRPNGFNRMQSSPNSRSYDMERPTTPSWADFLSAGFSNEANQQPSSPMFLTPDQQLPPLEHSRGRRAASVNASLGGDSELGPGELASITQFDLDDAFWWTWISSLAGEEPIKRKAVFGRCALIETTISKAKWIVIEEQVRGAEVLPDTNAHMVERKRGFKSFSQKARNTFRKPNSRKDSATTLPKSESKPELSLSRPMITSEQTTKIQSAAAALQQRKLQQENAQTLSRSRTSTEPTKTTSSAALPPVVLSEAMPAMKWANNFDKDAIREAYLANNSAGRGSPNPLPHSQSTPAMSKLDLHQGAGGTAIATPADSARGPGGITEKNVVNEPIKSDSRPTLAENQPKSSDSGTSSRRPRLDLDEEPKPSSLPSREPSREPGDRAIQESTMSSESLGGPASLAPSQVESVNPAPVPESRSPLQSKPIEPWSVSAPKAKESNGTGFRKMFGRKRPGAPSTNSSTGSPPIENGAANTGPPTALRPSVAQSGRRRSVLRRKNGAPEPNASSSALSLASAEPKQSQELLSSVQDTARRVPQDPAPVPSVQGGPQVPAQEPIIASKAQEQLPTTNGAPRGGPANHGTPLAAPQAQPAAAPQIDALFGPSKTGTSPTSTMEERAAVNEFSSFDQGPMSDVPAFVPDIDDDRTPPREASVPPRRKSPEAVLRKAQPAMRPQPEARRPIPAAASGPVSTPGPASGPMSTQMRGPGPAAAAAAAAMSSRGPVPGSAVNPNQARAPAPGPAMGHAPASRTTPLPTPAPTAPPQTEQMGAPVAKVASQQDRWARIKANAAERAARASEGGDEKAPTPPATTSAVAPPPAQAPAPVSQMPAKAATPSTTAPAPGPSVPAPQKVATGAIEDETIESRVARIKARVAELTGNPHGQQPSNDLKS